MYVSLNFTFFLLQLLTIGKMLDEKSHTIAVLLGQFDEIGAQRLGRLPNPLVKVNGAVRVGVGALKDFARLFVLKPIKAKRLKGYLELVLFNGATAISIGQFKELFEDGLAYGSLVRVNKTSNDVGMQRNHLGS